MATKSDFEFFSGDTQKLKYTIDDADAAPARKDLTGATITWGLAKLQGKAPFLTKTIGSGITVTDAANGELDVDLDPADTADVRGGDYYHELEIIDSLGNKATSAYGTITILADSIA